MQPSTVSIVGSGHSKFGRMDAQSLEDLIVSVSREALAEAGIGGTDVDAVFLGHFNSGLVPDSFASSLVQQADAGLRFKPASRCENACASGAAAITAGINAIRAGQAEIVLVVGVEKMTHRSTADVTKSLAGAGYQNDPVEASYSFPQLFGLVAQKYSKRYQDPLSAMAKIASKNHNNAMLNPLAQMQRPLSFEACNAVSDKNPEVAPPLRLTDCSLISDGAAAIVLASAERAVDFGCEVSIRSLAHVSDLLPLKNRDLIAFDGARKALSQAMEQAGVTLKDIDFAEVHDCFTIAELLIYEAMGLAPAGHGQRLLDDGTVYRGGTLPVNLSGGLKAKGHPVGATGVSMHAIAYRQLTGQAGTMQIEEPTLGLVFNMGGMAVANYASILEARRV